MCASVRCGISVHHTQFVGQPGSWAGVEQYSCAQWTQYSIKTARPWREIRPDRRTDERTVSFRRERTRHVDAHGHLTNGRRTTCTRSKRVHVLLQLLRSQIVARLSQSLSARRTYKCTDGGRSVGSVLLQFWRWRICPTACLETSRFIISYSVVGVGPNNKICTCYAMIFPTAGNTFCRFPHQSVRHPCTSYTQIVFVCRTASHRHVQVCEKSEAAAQNWREIQVLFRLQ